MWEINLLQLILFKQYITKQFKLKNFKNLWNERGKIRITKSENIESRKSLLCHPYIYLLHFSRVSLVTTHVYILFCFWLNNVILSIMVIIDSNSPHLLCRRPQWLPGHPCSTWEPDCGSAPDRPCPRFQTWLLCHPNILSESKRQLQKKQRGNSQWQRSL